MKKFNYLLFIILLSISSFAQNIPFKIQKSEIFKDEYKESQIVLSEEDGNGGVIIVRSYKSSGISPNSGYYFEHYDSNLKLINEYDFQTIHPSSHKYVVTLGIFKSDNIIRIIEMYYDINQKAYICNANSISKNDFKAENKELFRLTRDEIKEYGSFSLAKMSYDKSNKKLASKTNGYFTENSRGIAIIANENVFSIAIDFMSTDNSERLKLFLFDAKLNKKIEHVFKKQIKNSNYIFQNIDLSSDENTVYLLSKSYSKEAKKKDEGGKYQFEITKFTENKEETKAFDVKDHFIGSLKTIIFDKKIVCIGFYSNSEDNKYKGVSYFELDPNNLDVRLSKFNPFTEQFIIDKYGKVKDKELEDLNFKNILITPNNDIILNAEESYSNSSGGVAIGVGVGNGGAVGAGFGVVGMGGVNMGMSGGLYFGGIYGNSFTHFDDIVSIKINSEGNLIWARNINKKQNDISFASYTSVLKNSNVCFFINSKDKIKEISNNRIEFKGIGNVTLIWINEKGDFEYEKILDEEENEVPFMVSNGIKSGDSVFFLGRKGTKKQLLKVTL